MRSAVGVQNSRQLADLAVQTVISQIQQATQSNSTRQPGTYAWASQPGMIRVYDNNNVGGTDTSNDVEWYKLYSAQNMTVINPSISPTLVSSDLPETGSDTSGNWATPRLEKLRRLHRYQQPRDRLRRAHAGISDHESRGPRPSIASAAGTTANAVLGFDILNPPGFTAGTSSSAINNQAPMPVRWLYVLQNGTLVPGVASGTPCTVTVAGASSSNPIVGRVAFWTDDDTCKLNVNTAADGSYFDTPRFSSPA